MYVLVHLQIYREDQLRTNSASTPVQKQCTERYDGEDFEMKAAEISQGKVILLICHSCPRAGIQSLPFCHSNFLSLSFRRKPESSLFLLAQFIFLCYIHPHE